MGEPEDHGAEQEVAAANRARPVCSDFTRAEGANLSNMLADLELGLRVLGTLLLKMACPIAMGMQAYHTGECLPSLLVKPAHHAAAAVQCRSVMMQQVQAKGIWHSDSLVISFSDMSVQARIRMGRDIAKKGASVAGRVSQKAADISIRVAESIVRRVGPSAGFGRQLNAGGQSRADAAQEIAAASLVAAVEIYASMEEAARTVVKSSGQATADLVGHRCGAKQGPAWQVDTATP